MKHFNLLKSLLLLCALIVGSLSSWAADYSYTFSSKQFSSNASVELGSVSWTLGGDGGYWGYDGTKGQQFGSGGSPYKSLTLSTSGISGTITNIVVNASGASSVSAKISCSVGGSSFGTQNQSISSTAKNYTFSGSASGAIEISISQTSSKALYIKSITVTYVSSGGNVNIVDAPTFSPAAGAAITAGTTITLTQATADEIRYTLDGSDPTKTTGTVYSSPIVITTAKTIKAIAVEGDDVSSVATAAYTIDVAVPTFSPETGGNYLEGSTFALSASGNKIYYNLTTDGSTPKDPTVSSTEYSGPITITGTTKIKAIAVDSYGNASTVVTRTYTGITPVTLPFSWTGGGKKALAAISGVEVNGLGSDYADGTYTVKLDDTGDYIIIYTDNKPVNVFLGVKMSGGNSTSKITVQESNDGSAFTDVEELTISGSQNDVVNLETSNEFAATTRVIKLLFTKGSNVGVGPISITSETSPVSISAAGFATFVSDFDLDYSSVPGLKAYKATVSDVTISFDKVTTVPAGEGVLLQGNEGTYNVPLTSGVTPWAADDNAFVRGTGAAVATGDGPYNYILNKVNGVVGFYKANGQTVAKNRAYLQSTTAAARISLNFDEETTGISEVAKSDANNKVFDLQGRHIAQPTKGLYIMNGRKVLVK